MINLINLYKQSNHMLLNKLWIIYLLSYKMKIKGYNMMSFIKSSNDKLFYIIKFLKITYMTLFYSLNFFIKYFYQ